MELTPTDAATARTRDVARESGVDTTEAFDAALQQAMGGSTPTSDRPLTLGQMLRLYAGPGEGARMGSAAAGAPVGAAGVATGPSKSREVPTGTAAELGIGPVARPLPGDVGSAHGPRRHPVHGDVRMHDGVDIGAPTGTPIAAFAGGTVTYAGPRGGYGNVVIVEHAGGLETRYAHQSAIDVVVGQRVEAGQVVGRVGATGTATGPHLHFEIRRDGSSIDPAPYLP